MKSVVNAGRVRALNVMSGVDGPVVYWMSRDQRVQDNWALLYARELALEHKRPLIVLFCLVPDFLKAAARQYAFMLDGLEEVVEKLRYLNIPFFLLQGQPGEAIPAFITRHKAGVLVADFDPLRVKREWKDEVGRRLTVPFFEVDAHNIVPCREVSGKKEYGAYTIRPKIHRMLPRYLVEFPQIEPHPYPWSGTAPQIDWQGVMRGLEVDESVGEITWLKPGTKAGLETLNHFLTGGLERYNEDRNDPNKNGQSNLSPYLHFGQISAQRVALEVKDWPVDQSAKDAFLEELIVRRELADNFCFYEPCYDSVNGFPSWARQTLADHRTDARPYVYTQDQLENARTHDDLWNAAQTQMVERGKMHGYLRMYWAKKILEWSESAEEALRVAIYLNDKYQLDGRDPNGYAGIAWSLGGVHDRAWGQRQVFGKIRYMSYAGCRRKFDVDAYVKTWLGNKDA